MRTSGDAERATLNRRQFPGRSRRIYEESGRHDFLHFRPEREAVALSG